MQQFEAVFLYGLQPEFYALQEFSCLFYLTVNLYKRAVPGYNFETLKQFSYENKKIT